MNIRQRGEHTYQFHEAITDTYTGGRVDCKIDLFDCPLGHSNCLPVPSYSVNGIFIENSYSTRTTERVLPINIRSKSHSHIVYSRTYSVTTTTVTDVVGTNYAYTCPEGHSKCYVTYVFSTDEVPASISISGTESKTVTYIPPKPFNLRQKIKHNHNFRLFLAVNAWEWIKVETCASGHSLCYGGYPTWTAVVIYTSDSTDESYE